MVTSRLLPRLLQGDHQGSGVERRGDGEHSIEPQRHRPEHLAQHGGGHGIERAIAAGQYIGLALLAGLMGLAFYNDILGLVPR